MADYNISQSGSVNGYGVGTFGASSTPPYNDVYAKLPSGAIPCPYITKDYNWYEDNGYYFYPSELTPSGGFMIPPRIYKIFQFDNLCIGTYFVSYQSKPWSEFLPDFNYTNYEIIYVCYTENAYGLIDSITWEVPGYNYLILSSDNGSPILPPKFVDRASMWAMPMCEASTGHIYAIFNTTQNKFDSGAGIMQRYGKPIEFWNLEPYVEYSNSVGVVKVPFYNGSRYIEYTELPLEVDTSGTGGGDGSFNIDSDVIDWGDMPTIGFANSGLGRLYTPNEIELYDFASWLYSSNVLDTLAKMWSNPMELVVSLGIVPLAPTHTGTRKHLYVGGVDTGVDMTPITNQYEILDCGYIDIDEYYGTSLDYGGYTVINLYLPYIGVRQLKCDEVMGGRVHVKYFVDLATGTCIAKVRCTRGDYLDAVLYQFEGNCFVQLPMMARDFSNTYQSIIRSVSDNFLSGNVVGSIGGGIDSAINVMSSKPNVSKSGSIGASGGFMSIKKPYLIIERPIQSFARNYNSYVGFPSNITSKLSSLHGYTEIEEVICSTLKCTKEEQDAIITKLKEGVII